MERTLREQNLIPRFQICVMVCWQARAFPPVSLPVVNAFKGCRQVVLSSGAWQLTSPSQTPCAQPQDGETASLATQTNLML